jgi:ABC-type phosphate transport system substrate-binding protein
MSRHITLTLASLLLASQAAFAEIVVVGHPNAAPLTKEQVAEIYLGKSQAAQPIDLPEASPIRASFYEKATGKDAAQIKATWARLAFSGKAQPPKEAADAAAVKKEVASNPKAVGYIDKSAADASVKVLLTLP